jgi:hypothetical protein
VSFSFFIPGHSFVMTCLLSVVRTLTESSRIDSGTLCLDRINDHLSKLTIGSGISHFSLSSGVAVAYSVCWFPSCPNREFFPSSFHFSPSRNKISKHDPFYVLSFVRDVCGFRRLCLRSQRQNFHSNILAYGCRRSIEPCDRAIAVGSSRDSTLCRFAHATEYSIGRICLG